MSTSEPRNRHPASWDDEDLLAACDMQFTRRSGPGGQHRNKVETAVTLTHRASGISAEASEERSQAENRRTALFRLRLKLAISVRTGTSDRLPGQPSELWQQRRLGTRISVGSEHRDFPSLLAEALDSLSACGYEPSQAAQHLGVTSSQLVSLLRQHPAALAALNEQRAVLGLHRLR